MLIILHNNIMLKSYWQIGRKKANKKKTNKYIY